MNDRPFIDAIRDSPDDDAPRLVFADWLDERGESVRAEFIRVQCDLARTPTFDPRYEELHVRQLELLAVYEKDWLGEWADRLVRWEFQRGFLHSITITADPFVTSGDALFRDHPVHRVGLVNDRGESLDPPAIAEVVAAKAMSGVRALEAAGCRRGEPMCGMYGGNVATSEWLAALAGAEHVERLEEIHLNGDTRCGRQEIQLPAWRRFCKAAHLRTLRHIDLSNQYSRSSESLVDVTRILGQASFVKNLRGLSFALCQVGDEAANHLAQAPLEKLESLDLACCDALGEAGLTALLTSSHFKKLVSLGIPPVAPLGSIPASPLLARLHTLDLIGGLPRLMDEHELAVLLPSARLKDLRSLTIIMYAEEIPPTAVAEMLRQPWAANLHKLRLCCQGLSPEHVEPLFARPVKGPTPLHSLSLRDCDGIGTALGQWPGLAGLTELDLTRVYGQECEADTAALLKSKYLSRRLTRLDLTGSCKSFANMKRLAGCAALSGLRWLGFGWNSPSRKAIKLLTESPHLAHLEALHLSSMYDDNAVGALKQLAATPWPRLRDVVVGSGTDEEGTGALYERFGPRLRIWADC